MLIENRFLTLCMRVWSILLILLSLFIVSPLHNELQNMPDADNFIKFMGYSFIPILFCAGLFGVLKPKKMLNAYLRMLGINGAKKS
mgnify:CR=1 FL=1